MRPLILLMALLVSLAACGSTDAASGSAGASDEAAPPASTPPVESEVSVATPQAEAEPTPSEVGSTSAGAEVFELTMPTVDGGELDGASLAGRDLALWFWAPW